MKKPPIDDLKQVARLARALASRQGMLPVKLDGALTQTGTATASIRYWSVADNAWKDSGEDLLNVRGLGLNLGESYPAGTVGIAVWLITTWVFIPLGCEPDDTETAAASQQATYSPSAGANPNAGPMVLRRRR